MARLAIEGGQPVRTEPLAPWPHFDDDAIGAACDVLDSGKVNYWTGEEGERFEEEFSQFVGREYGVAVANGTVALELCLEALSIGAGDDVVVPSRTFVATASCVALRGARPVWADVDPVSGNVTAETIEDSLTAETRAIIVVHLGGWPCEMDGIMELAKVKGLAVVEDCAQSHGARYKGQSTGSFGDMAAFSFCQDKIMTTGGEGGMVVTDDRELYERAWSYKDHGKSYDAMFHREHPPGFRWVHESVGTNWRMTEMQAAIGRAQLRKVPSWIERRREHASMLSERFSQLPVLRVPVPGDDVFHSYYKYYVFVRPEELKADWDRDRMLAAIDAEGIPGLSGSCSEVYLEKGFAPGLRPGERLPVAKQLGETSMMFMVHPTMNLEDMEDICTAVEKVVDVAAR